MPERGFEVGHDFNDLGATGAALLNNPQTPSFNWGDPEILPDLRPPVQAFREEFLPEGLRSWNMDIADRMQCPPDFPAVAAIVSMASLVGRKIGIRPKKHDDWTVIPNLWGGVIGRPGLMKTPAIDQATLPLRRLAAEALKRGEEDKQAWEINSMRRQVQEGTIKEAMKKAIKKGEDVSRLVQELQAIREESTPPGARRYIVNDSTVERLGEILRDNPNGVLVFRDELTGLRRTLDRDGHESDRAFFLEAWNGTGSFTYDRIGRGMIHIPAICVSILGGIQPGPLSEYVREANRNGTGADGLLQRFQLLVWPDDPGSWKNVDRWPNSMAKNQAFEIFQWVDELDPRKLGAQRGDEEEDVPFLRFTDEAQEAFDHWREILEKEKLRSGEPEIVEAALSKYRKLVPALSLLFHLTNKGSGPVSQDAFLRAVDWGDYLESHMRRVYQAVGNPALAGAHAMLKKILNKEIEDGMTLREIYRKGWTDLDSERVIAAMEVLEEYSIAKIETPPISDKGGRQTFKIRINPKLGREG